MHHRSVAGHKYNVEVKGRWHRALCTDVISADVSCEPPSRDSASPCRNTHDDGADERAGDSGRGGRFTDETKLVAATREELTMPAFAMAPFIASSFDMSTTRATAWEVMALGLKGGGLLRFDYLSGVVPG